MSPPVSSAPLLVVMSMMPAVRSPNSAGNAPVTSFMFSTSRGLSVCPKKLMPSGRMMPSRRYWIAGVLASNVKLSERILCDVRRLQNHLIEQRIVATGRRLNGDFSDIVGRSADIDLDSIARIIQALRRYGDFPAQRRSCAHGRAPSDLRKCG